MNNKTLAIIGFVLSLVVGGLPGLIVSAIALKKFNETGETDGKGFAVAGLIIGIVMTVIAVIGVACYVCAFGAIAAAGAAGGSY